MHATLVRAGRGSCQRAHDYCGTYLSYVLLPRTVKFVKAGGLTNDDRNKMQLIIMNQINSSPCPGWVLGSYQDLGAIGGLQT